MVERGGLENRCAFTGTEGSNPSLSAIIPKPPKRGLLFPPCPRVEPLFALTTIACLLSWFRYPNQHQAALSQTPLTLGGINET